MLLSDMQTFKFYLINYTFKTSMIVYFSCYVQIDIFIIILITTAMVLNVPTDY